MLEICTVSCRDFCESCCINHCFSISERVLYFEHKRSPHSPGAGKRGAPPNRRLLQEKNCTQPGQERRTGSISAGKKVMENTAQEKKYNFFNRTFVVVLIIQCCYSMAATFVSTPIGRQGVSLGASMTLLGIISSIMSCMYMIMRPVAGAAVDRINPKLVLIGQYTLLVTSYILSAVATSIPVYFASRIVYGLAFGSIGVTMPTVVGRAMPKEKMAQGLGLYMMLPMVLKVFTPNISLFLVDNWGYAASYGVSIALIVIALFLLITLKVDFTAGSSKEKKKFSWNNVIAVEAFLPTLSNIFVGMVFTAIISNIVVYGDAMGFAQIALFMSFYNGANVITRGLGGYLGDKIGVRQTMYPCFLLMIAALFLLGTTEQFGLVIVAAVLFAFGFGGAQPVMTAVCMRTVSPERAGAANATYMLGADLGTIIASTLVGVLVDSFGFQTMYLCMIIPGVIAMLLFALCMKIQGRQIDVNSGRTAK